MIEHKLRGTRILQQKSSGFASIFLLDHSGESYIVSIQYYFLRFQYNKKNFAFSDKEDAERFFNSTSTKYLV